MVFLLKQSPLVKRCTLAAAVGIPRGAGGGLENSAITSPSSATAPCLKDAGDADLECELGHFDLLRDPATGSVGCQFVISPDQIHPFISDPFRSVALAGTSPAASALTSADGSSSWAPGLRRRELPGRSKCEQHRHLSRSRSAGLSGGLGILHRRKPGPGRAPRVLAVVDGLPAGPPGSWLNLAV